ncbi:MAG: efflux RND transporter periplasmic adaptor subunit [Candidatus Sumerlaeaceae bacterium]
MRADILRICRRLLLLPAVVVLCSACNKSEHTGLVVSGRVEVDSIHIGSKVGGRVAKLHYEESQSVKAGEPVVSLEDQELVAQRDQAKAAQAQAQAQLDLLLAGTRAEDIMRADAVVSATLAELDMRRKGFREEEVREAAAQLASAQSEQALAQREFDRTQALFKTRTIDQSEFDKARSAVETAKARVNAATQRAALMQSGSRPEEITRAEAQLAQARADQMRLKNGPRPEEIAAQRAAVDSARANVARFESQLAEMKITAPADAMVETLDLKVGDLVKPGETIAVLNLRRAPYVRCFVPENRLAEVKPGQEVAVTVDSIPGERLRGKVRRLASDAEFTPRNVQTTEKRSELVFEMKVDVIDSPERLRAGMYADVHVK